MRPADRLADLGLVLPEVPAPLAAYLPAVRSGSQIFTAGQLPLRDGELLAAGLVGDQVDPEAAYELVRVATLNGLAAATQVAGELNAITGVARVVVYLACAPGFAGHPAVANGASDLLGELFEGGHARSAVGVASLPMNSPVEVELTLLAPEQPQVVPL